MQGKENRKILMNTAQITGYWSNLSGID